MFTTATSSLARQPWFTIAGVASLALAVGASSVLIIMVDALWWRPGSLKDPDRIVAVYLSAPGSEDGALSNNVSEFDRRRFQDVPALAAVSSELQEDSVAIGWTPVVRLDWSSAPVRARAVEHNYFAVFDIAITGRHFTQNEDRSGTDPVAIASLDFWRRTFGDREFTPIELQTTRGPLMLVGMTEGRFVGPFLGEQTDLWLSFGALGRYSELAAAPNMAAHIPLRTFARLRPSANPKVAQSEVRQLVDNRVVLRSLGEVKFELRATGDLQRLVESLRVHAVVAMTVSVFGAITLANLLLGRLASRQDIAARIAVGATPESIAWLIVTEVTILASAGAVLGLCLSVGILRTVQDLELPIGLTIRQLAVSIDWRVIALTALVAAVAALPACAMGVREARRTNVYAALSGDRTTRRSSRLRQVLLAAEVALSVIVLSFTAGLAVQLFEIDHSEVGFARNRLLFVSVRPRLMQHFGAGGGGIEALHRDYRRLLQSIGDLPEVSGVSYGFPPIVEGEVPGLSVVSTEGREIPIRAVILRVGTNYINTTGLKLRAGREFTPADEAGAVGIFGNRRSHDSGSEPLANPVVIVDRQFTDRVWGDQNPIGKTFVLRKVTYAVVGVVESPIQLLPSARGLPTAIVIFPFDNFDVAGVFPLVIRTRSDSGRCSRLIYDSVVKVFADPSVLSIRTVGQVATSVTVRERFAERVLSWCSAITVGLTLLGVSGLVTLSVNRRRRELGMRIVLGATPSAVAKPVILGLIRVGCAGVLLGYFATIATLRAIQSTMQGLESFNPIASATVAALVLLAVGAIATLATAPLRRTSPSELLRSL